MDAAKGILEKSSYEKFHEHVMINSGLQLRRGCLVVMKAQTVGTWKDNVTKTNHFPREGVNLG